MKIHPGKRIGIFQYDWSMYGFVRDLIVQLAEAGYLVDVFHKGAAGGPGLIDATTLQSAENIRYLDFTAKPTIRGVLERRLTRLLNIVAMRLRLPRNSTPENIIAPEILDRSIEIVGSMDYCCFIGIEKKGLIWAGMLSRIRGCPLIYYSLELYVEDSPLIDRYYHLRAAEKAFHRLAAATIIQDKPRARALMKSNDVNSEEIIYLPVSVRGAPVAERSGFLQSHLSIGSDKKILLYMGSIYPTRCLTQLVKAASELVEDTVLVVHGWGPRKYVRHLQSVADRTKVIFSLDIVTEDKIPQLVSSAHIGIALYDTANLNDRLTAFSSAKMAHYTQCGVPVIAFDTESFHELMAHHRCGELVHSIGEIPLAARKILGDYVAYRREAQHAFRDFYDLNRNAAAFVIRLSEVAQHRHANRH